MVLAAVGGFLCPARASSDVWLTAAGGHEDDVTANLDLGLDPVPGGVFAQLSGGVDLDQGSWRIDVQGSWQRFLESGHRRLAAASLGSEARVHLGGRWYLQPSATGFFLEDSARRDARLLGAGAQAALLRRGARLDLEWRGGWEGRRHPDLIVAGLDSVGRDHRENRLLAGPGVAWRPNRAWTLYGTVTGSLTAARDDWYDARELTAWCVVRWRTTAQSRLVAHGFRRHRDFPERTGDGADDLTLQLGLAAEVDLAARLTATLGWVGTRYRDAQDGRQDLDRFSVALTHRFGGARQPFAHPATSVPRAGRPIRLRLSAPDAGSVAVVGDFNGWDPTAHPLRRRDDGTWDIELRLPAGRYQYAFWVDGALVPPPDGAATVPDGFGGENGLLVVQP